MSKLLADQPAIEAALLNTFATLSPQLQRCARYILDTPQAVGTHSMRQLAAQIGVNPNSLVRLAKQLGFSGYQEMRERFRDFVQSGMGSASERARYLQSLASQHGNAGLVAEMALAHQNNLEQMLEQNSQQQLDAVVDQLLQAKQVYVLGLGLAYPIAYQLWYLARMAFAHFILVPRHGSQPQDDLLHIGAKDCLLAMTFQPYRIETVNALRYSKQQGATTIALTDSPSASVFREADIALAAPTHTPQFFQSNLALTAMVDQLVALLVSAGGESAATAIETFNSSRWEAKLYVDY